MRSFLYIILISFLSSCSTTSYLSQNNYVSNSNKTEFEEVKAAIKKPIVTNNDFFEEKPVEETSSVSVFENSVNNIIIEAKSYLGTPYRYGGTTRRGIDCSAFMQHIYNVEGIELPRVSANQAKTGIPISRGELQKGDLIFFSTTSRYRITHVGMVTEVSDDIYFIHSASSQGVSISVLSHPYWGKRYRSARRPNKFVQPKLVQISQESEEEEFELN